MKGVLTAEHEEILRDERRLLSDLRALLSRLGAGAEVDATLERAARSLDELFLLVVVGEFNAGKSAFINALLGADVLPEGVTPTTAEVQLLSWGERVTRAPLEPHLLGVRAPVEMLREIHLVDTPGTNAIIREHELITERFVPRADLVLFVTSADRPFTETERAFLERIRGWGKKVVVAINKVDILGGEEDVREVSAFVVEHATRLLGATPRVFPVSARLAARAKRGEGELWEASRFAALEHYVHETLDEEGRVRLKLASPLGVALRVVDDQTATVAARLDLLRGDLDTLDEIERQLAAYRADVARDFAPRIGDIERELVEMEQRGHRFFDDTLRIGRVVDLLNRARIQQGFERDVVGDTPQQVEKRVVELVDWLVESDFRQWQAVTDHLAERRREHRGHIVGDTATRRFTSARAELIDSVGREAHRVVEGYDKAAESQALADSARNAVAASAAAGAGAVGLGTLISVAATTAAADVTGLLAAGLLAALGLFILPARRRRAKQEMRAKVAAMRESLTSALRGELEREVERGRQRIDESIAPYSRFVRSEHASLESARTALADMRRAVNALLARVES